MANYWKIGAVSGFIASLFTGVVLLLFFNSIVFSLELYEPFWREIISKSVEVNILLNIVWAVILGIIYSKAYHAIPGKGALKGLCWGLIVYVLVVVRTQCFNLAYGYNLTVIADLLTWGPPMIACGLITGILYELLCSRYCPIKEIEIKKYSLISGFYSGAIAGFLGGMAASIVAVLGPAMGLWQIVLGPSEITFDFWMAQAGTHIMINMFWGTIFGLMFTRAYDLVAGKRFTKGLVYGLIIYLITSFQVSTYVIFPSVQAEAWPIMPSSWGIGGMIIGAANGVVFAIVLGLLYRKSRE